MLMVGVIKSRNWPMNSLLCIDNMSVRSSLYIANVKLIVLRERGNGIQTLHVSKVVFVFINPKCLYFEKSSDFNTVEYSVVLIYHIILSFFPQL